MLADEDEEQREEVAGVRQTHMSFEWSDGTGESDFNQLLGKRVRIIGLTGRPELNGCLGYVVEYARVGRARESEDGRKRGQAGGGRQGA